MAGWRSGRCRACVRIGPRGHWRVTIRGLMKTNGATLPSAGATLMAESGRKFETEVAEKLKEAGIVELSHDEWLNCKDVQPRCFTQHFVSGRGLYRRSAALISASSSTVVNST